MVATCRLRVAAGGVIAAVAALLLAGCGESLPPTVPVTGTVIWQGKPLPDGQVVFKPKSIAEGLPKRPATGYINPDGTFRLATFRNGDGVVPGEYHVLVFSYVDQPPAENDDLNPAKQVLRIPDKYADGSTCRTI